MSKKLSTGTKGLQASYVRTNLGRERRKIAEMTIRPSVRQFHVVLCVNVHEIKTDLRRSKKKAVD